MGVVQFWTVVLCAVLLITDVSVGQNSSLRFPDDFIFGTSTSAYQVEGAWNEDGKGWSMWDHLVRTQPNYVPNGATGDIAANSYHNYKRDVEMLKELGVNAYRFSISWTRILPYGRPDYVNPLGIAYYNNLINELLRNDITPFVTLYHWDLPQNFNEQGGWTNEEIIEWFGDYARVLYQNFGDRVKHWLTFNEPYIHCYFSYGIGLHPPRIKSPGYQFYECGRNFLLGHAKAYHIYNDEFRASQGGQVGAVISLEWAIAESNTTENLAAIDDFVAFHIGHFMDPIFSTQGNYPLIMSQRVANVSARQGLDSTRLRPLTQEQVDYVRGTSDFMALNHYSSVIVYRNASVEGMYEEPSFDDDCNVGKYYDPSWPLENSAYAMTREYAPGFYQLLHYIKDTYNNPVIYVTENGFSTIPGLDDDNRIQYYRNYLSALLAALHEGVNIKGYFAWSLMDNFEWAFGYEIRFGLYDVDITDPNRKRTPKKSAFVYKEIVRSKEVDYDYNPDITNINNARTVGPSIPLFVIGLLSYTLYYIIINIKVLL